MAEPKVRSDKAQPDKTGPWEQDRSGRLRRDLEIKGVQYIQWDNEKGSVVKRGPSTAVQLQSIPRSQRPASFSAPAGDPRNPSYSLSTDPSSLARQSISQSASHNLPPRSSTEGIPHNDGARPNVEESLARSGPNERGKSYRENRYRDREVEIIPATTKRPAPGRAVSAPQPSMSAPETNRADPPSYLSPLGREFIKIKEREYGTCENFMCNNPEIFEEKLANFQLEAVRLAREGKSSMVRTCVQQLLLLRKCSSMSDRDCGIFFFRMREGDQATLTNFLGDFDTTLKAVKAKSDPDERSSQPKPLPPISREPRHAPEEIRHTQEPTRYGSVHSDLPLSVETLSISPRDDQDRFRNHGQAGNRPPTLRQMATRRRSTLDSVDEHPDPDLQSQSTSQAGDASIADPNQLDIRGNGGEHEELDHRYQKRNDARKFFAIGRVFAMLFHEGAGDVKGGHLSHAVPFKVGWDKNKGKYNQDVYSHIRRMVVVRERHGYCWCIPINTYNYQGVAKKGLSTQDRLSHCVIHMDNTDPTTDPREKGLMTKKPIAVTAANPEQKLHHMSRLNFGKVYSVEWNVKVMNVGKVNGNSMVAYTGYWHNELTGP